MTSHISHESHCTFDAPADGSTLYRTMGAHTVENGVRFSVWAPNAREVSVISEGNGWSPGQDMLSSSNSGVWQGIVQGTAAGTRYKYAIRTQDGQLLEKADPFAFASDLRPATASIVCDLRDYEWTDAAWLQKRRQTDWLRAPVSIYEVHLASWKRPQDGRTYLNYRELAPALTEYVLEAGYTHIQLMPVTEHPFDGSWGYQTTGYFSPTSRFGTPDDFRYFVNYLHHQGLAVLIDWVPGHFPTDDHGLARFDGTAVYEHADPRQGYHPDWNTYIFNYGRREVTEFLQSSARFWCDVYHIDGIRVDAVASMLYLDYSRDSDQWIPNQYGGRENLEAIEFLRNMNTMLHAEFPGVLSIAEESTAWPGVSRPVYAGGLGFTMKWDMGWMNDTLRFMQRDGVHRKWHLNDLTFRAIYAFTENFVLPLSHDEVVHGKKSLLLQMSGDEWQRFANLRLLYSMQFMMPGKKLQFMGDEIAQWKEWNHDGEIDWALRKFDTHEGVRRMICDVNRLYVQENSLHESDAFSEGFEWVVGDDTQNCVAAWIRKTHDQKQHMVIAANLTSTPHSEYRIGVPEPGFYREIFNSDAEWYGGTGTGNLGGAYTSTISSHGFEQSISVFLPPLAVVAFKPIPISKDKPARATPPNA